MTRIRCWLPCVLGLGAGVALWLTLTAYTVRADGAPIPPYGTHADIEMPAQKAIIVYDEQNAREDLVLSVQLLGESPEAAWVVPVPAQPEVNTASAEWFVQLSDLTQPEIVTETVFLPPCGAMAAPGEVTGVQVLSREKVGAYDVSVLASDDPMALLNWLNENGYAFPKRGEPILEEYVSEGWVFVATRVRPGENANLDVDVQPLWLSFQTDRPVYPMRLTALVTTPINVLIYVLADHRVESTDVGSGLMLDFAGQLTLQPEPSESGGLGDLLTRQPYYVTKFRNWYYSAVSTQSDLYFQRASDDMPYRRTVYRRVQVCCPAYPALAPLGLVAGLSLWKRRRMKCPLP